jgi:NitT/TauT family transport system substrate-binding protein
MLSRASVLRVLGACTFVAGGRTALLAQTPAVVRVGTGITEGSAQLFYALDQGFFKKNGIDVQMTILRSGGPAMEGVAAGHLDIGTGKSVSLGSAMLRGIPFVVIAPGQMWYAGSPSSAIVVPIDSPIKSAKDLAGKTVAVISLRNVGELAYDAYLDANGVDPASVKFLELPPLQVGEAVVAGRVAAGSLIDPELTNALGTHKVRRLANAYDAIAKQFYLTAWFATRDWADKNKDVTKRFVDAVIQGGIWGEANRERATDALARLTKTEPVRSSARFGRRLEPSGLQPLWDAAYKYKIYNAPLRAADYLWMG